MKPEKLKFIIDVFNNQPPEYQDDQFAFTCYIELVCQECPFEKECMKHYEETLPSVTVEESNEIKEYFPEMFI